jgi:outer membrane protein OmpA-like peptidoglycan-associated protein
MEMRNIAKLGAAVAAAVIMLLPGGAPAGAAEPRPAAALHVDSGFIKLIGGPHDYSNLDQEIGLGLRPALSSRWLLDLSLHYGWVRPGVDRPEAEAGWTTGSGAGLRTIIWHPRVGLRYLLARGRLRPHLDLYAGLLIWRVLDLRSVESPGLFPGGAAFMGYDESGQRRSLKDANPTAAIGAGLEIALSSQVGLDLGMRLTGLSQSDRDNIGLSGLYGSRAVDANGGLFEMNLGLVISLGRMDADGDGIPPGVDLCDDLPEDFDGFEDYDGCPDLDNDRDSIPDLEDKCPDLPEDRDGFADTDGCPDPDNDADGVPDSLDRCPDKPEDLDGFADADGCPDPDNDGDGVLDAEDDCPDTPRGRIVDAHGCPPPPPPPPVIESQVLQGVQFLSGSDRLNPASRQTLEEVAQALLADPTVQIEVRGHTDSLGPAAANRDLSYRRALAVRDALIRLGVSPSRITAVGLGEDFPIASNSTPEGRARNRRVEIQRLDR